MTVATARFAALTRACGFAGWLAAAATADAGQASLTLIPPSPVTDQITVDIRAAVRLGRASGG